MKEIFGTFIFFLPQILIGAAFGAILSGFGVILILRRMSFFGVTLSQLVSASVAVCLYFSISGSYLVPLISLLFVIPFLLLSREHLTGKDAVLGILFVSFTAVSQILLSFGGNVKNHLMSAFFGDILTSEVSMNPGVIVSSLTALALFFIFYRDILFYSFDEDEFRVSGRAFLRTELIFYFCLTVVLSHTINLLGSFYSIAHMLFPAFIMLPFVRSMKMLFISSVCISLFSTVTGFIISLFPMGKTAEAVYLPSSSTIVLVLMTLAGLGFLLQKWKKKG